MSEQDADNPTSDPTDEAAKPLTIWEDPSVPVGNGPPMAKWPVVGFAIAWGAWLVFLFVMMTA